MELRMTTIWKELAITRTTMASMLLLIATDMRKGSMAITTAIIMGIMDTKVAGKGNKAVTTLMELRIATIWKELAITKTTMTLMLLLMSNIHHGLNPRHNITAKTVTATIMDMILTMEVP